MNQHVRNLNRIEFVVTNACTGRCRHCSEGEHINCRVHMDGDIAADVVRKICGKFQISSLMTFGGEALLYPDVVCQIHAAAREMNIPQRQLITNGFFTDDEDKIRHTAKRLAESGVNALLLSVDAFHQETIPLDPVKSFAEAAREEGIWLRTNPAWLVSEQDKNPYNVGTGRILQGFERLGIERAPGNVIFPSGNALKYLGEYFESGKVPCNPYEEDPEDVRAISISPEGDVLGGNVYREDIRDILENYMP